MSNYNYKEKKIIKQCNEGPYHTLITKLTIKETSSGYVLEHVHS